MMPRLVHLVCIVLLAGVSSVPAQDPGTLNPTPLPPLANPDLPKTPAKELFVRKTTPLQGAARSIGSYNNGCLAGAAKLPITGPGWQVSGCRAIGIGGIQASSPSLSGSPIAPRRLAGPGSLSATCPSRVVVPCYWPPSHQIGLDVDIWFTRRPTTSFHRRNVSTTRRSTWSRRSA